MFGFLKDYVLHWPQSGWGMIGAYAALVAVLPFRVIETSVGNRRPSPTKSGGLGLQLQQWTDIANTPAAVIEAVVLGQADGADAAVIPQAGPVAATVSVDVAPVKAAASKLRTARAKLGLKGQPLHAFRQAPRRAKASKTSKSTKAAKKRAVYQPRCKANRTQRMAPQTRIITQKVHRSVGNVVCFPIARARPTVGVRLKRAA
jgi:hypothetical protein